MAEKCTTCNHIIHEGCNYNQGRCPHRKPMIEIQPKDTSRGHFYVSLAKSGLRIIAGYALINSNFVLAGGLFIAAEVLGVVEELV